MECLISKAEEVGIVGWSPQKTFVNAKMAVTISSRRDGKTVVPAPVQVRTSQTGETKSDRREKNNITAQKIKVFVIIICSRKSAYIIVRIE